MFQSSNSELGQLCISYVQLLRLGYHMSRAVLVGLGCVFPVVHGACKSCSFSEENRGDLEQLAYHERRRQKLAILTR